MIPKDYVTFIFIEQFNVINNNCNIPILNFWEKEDSKAIYLVVIRTFIHISKNIAKKIESR